MVPEDQLLTLDIGPNMTYILVEDEDGQYVVEDLVNAPANRSVSPSDLSYYFYSQTNQVVAVKVTNSNLEPLSKKVAFQPRKDTFFIIHGWKNSHRSLVNIFIKKAMLSKHDVNLFVVDWSPIASGSYLSAKQAVNKVGTRGKPLRYFGVQPFVLC
ncbi:hypothetical protein NQ317_008578 [Molorchus minor]|uniref:Lipase domain-containing protein n=1 Tax=Molorchus minor TaxID=1323400 RepID=A0ABQ9J320_9CUCU|nr:hypothetical protein NQ317_008578 [Molorchus minor]